MATEQVFQLLKAFEQFADRFSPAPSILGQSKVVQYIRIQLILNEFFKGISLQDTHLSSAVPAEVFSPRAADAYRHSGAGKLHL